MKKGQLKEIIEVPWILLETGFWAIKATGQYLYGRYLKWRIGRLEDTEVVDEKTDKIQSSRSKKQTHFLGKEKG